MERKRNATNFVRVVSMMEFDRWTEANSIGLVCSDKGESPDIGRTVECSPHARVGQQDFSPLPYPSLVSLMDRGGWREGEEKGERTDRGRG